MHTCMSDICEQHSFEVINKYELESNLLQSFAELDKVAIGKLLKACKPHVLW